MFLMFASLSLLSLFVLLPDLFVFVSYLTNGVSAFFLVPSFNCLFLCLFAIVHVFITFGEFVALPLTDSGIQTTVPDIAHTAREIATWRLLHQKTGSSAVPRPFKLKA